MFEAAEIHHLKQAEAAPLGDFNAANEQEEEADTHRQGGGAVGGVVLPGGQGQRCLVQLRSDREGGPAAGGSLWQPHRTRQQTSVAQATAGKDG